MGIIGPSAAGKTSLARAILGVWPLRAGIVRIDECRHKSVEQIEVRPPFRLFTSKDIELFQGSVGDNICRFSDTQSRKNNKSSKDGGHPRNDIKSA